MKFAIPKIRKFKTSTGSEVRAYGPVGGGARVIGAVRSGHWHLAIPAGGPRPDFESGPKPQKKFKKMY